MSTLDLTRGKLVLHYRIEAVLGRGGMSVVYLAEDLRLKRRVALKLLAPALAKDERFRERFLSESELAASLDHANVIPVYEAGEADGSLFIAMRYVEGSDLKALLGEGPLSEEQTVVLAEQVGAALDAAHERGLVHGDVKPSNILIDERGHAYLADFGLTKRIGGDRSEPEAQLMGTIDYVAPEQIRGDEVDGRADIYSLGGLLYECLTGRQPFTRGNDAATLYAHLEDPSPTTGGPADPVLARALAKSPDDRYQTCAELTADARVALGVAAPRRSRLPIAVAASVAAIAVAAAALTAFFLLRSDGATAAAAHGHLYRIDASNGAVKTEASIGTVPTGVAVAPGRVWVSTLGDSGIWRLDTGSGDATRIAAQGRPTGLVARGNRVYVALTESGAYGGGGGTGTGRVAVVNPDSGSVSRTFNTVTTLGITNGPGGIWVTRMDGVARLKVETELSGRIDRRFPFPPALGVLSTLTELTSEAGDLWVLGDALDHTLWRIDPADGRILASIHLPVTPAGIGSGGGAVWVTGQLEDEVVRIDPSTNRVAAVVKTGREPLAVAAGDGSVWVANAIDRTVSKIDPRTNRVVATIPVGSSPTAIATGPDNSIWVAGDAS